VTSHRVYIAQAIRLNIIKMTCSHFLMILAVMVSLTSCSQAQSSSLSFLSQCIDLANLGIGLQCVGTVCKGEEGTNLNLEQVQMVECVEDKDCRTENTGMECVHGRCDCPPYQALNLTSCSCQGTAQCPLERREGEEECTEHNGRKCEDKYCSCYSSTDYSTLLVDPSSLFCMLPGDRIAMTARGSGAGSLGLAVLGALLGFVSVVVGAVLVVMVYKHCVCQKGDYACENPEDIPEEHIAAWDHPSLDYINREDEDIVFTLCHASDNVRMSNASTIYVMDDETPNYNLDHDNMAYVEEEDPRHD